MSDPTLNYESPASDRPSTLRTAVWITLRILAVFYCLGGVCIIVPGTLVLFMETRRPKSSPIEPWIMWIELTVFNIGPLLSGISYLWASFAIKRHSRSGAITAFTVTLINIGLILVFTTTAIVDNLHASRTNPFPLPLGLVCGFMALFDAFIAWLLWGVLREHRLEGIA